MNSQRCYEKKHPDHKTIVKVGECHFGSPHIEVISGPCSVESFEQLYEVALTLKKLGCHCIRGGAFKPRTSPYSFQGLGETALQILDTIREQMGLAVITEIMSQEQIQQAEAFVDCYQVGSRNMQNFELLKSLGKQDKPVLLKRGLSATLEEFLMAAEYILSEGNEQVILCERGIRSFDPATRNVLDLAAVAKLKELTHLPIIVDPSHATGQRSLVPPTALAAVAVGADGLMIETHPNPDHSISDAEQAISLETLESLLPKIDAVAQAIGREEIIKEEAVLIGV